MIILNCGTILMVFVSNPALNWYKENQVEMIYTYMDENDNLVTIFQNSFLKVLITMQSNENV